MARPSPSGAEYRKMIAGELYRPADPELREVHGWAQDVLFRFNHTPPGERQQRKDLLRELLGTSGRVHIEPMLHVDYGLNIHLEDDFYANANCVMLDVAPIHIGAQTMFAPAVQLLTATHPVDAEERVSGAELGAPITIGSRVWLGGGVIVCPGVTIGDDVVVGAGSIVTRDLPDRVVAVGNPARVVREL